MMELRPFGRLQHPVPVVGQGTWYIDQTDRAAAIATLRQGMDLGMTHIDTAEMSPMRRTGTAIFRPRTARAAACCRKSPLRMAPRRAFPRGPKPRTLPMI
jgi:hypothetical protein